MSRRSSARFAVQRRIDTSISAQRTRKVRASSCGRVGIRIAASVAGCSIDELCRTMHSTRRTFLNLVFGGLILGSLYDIATDTEHWPFSRYPMFSGEWRSSSFKWLRLVGVTPTGQELTLASNDYLRPFDLSRLPKAFRQMLEREDGPSRVAIAVRDCLRATRSSASVARTTVRRWPRCGSTSRVANRSGRRQTSIGPTGATLIAEVTQR